MRTPWRYVALRITASGWEVIGWTENHSRVLAHREAEELGQRAYPGITQHVVMNANAFNRICGKEDHTS